MKQHTTEEVEALTNHDGLLCKPPWQNEVQKRQYYARFINRMLWQHFSPEDWRNVKEIIDDVRVDSKLKRATRFLLKRHT